MRINTAAFLTGLLFSGPALAFDTDLTAILRPDDQMRLQQLDMVAGQTLRHALAAAPAQDVAVLVQALSGTGLPPEKAAAALTGNWSCRMLKLGQDLPLVVYQPFRCSIGADGHFQKITGSQRSKGQIGMLNGQLVYVGTAYIAGDTPPAYQDLPAQVDPTGTPQVVPDVGMVEVTGPNAARIIMPLPHLESDLNLLMLTR